MIPLAYITLDDLASGFNIADFLTLNPDFKCMLGFTQFNHPPEPHNEPHQTPGNKSSSKGQTNFPVPISTEDEKGTSMIL
jgi:hypothetical protein